MLSPAVNLLNHIEKLRLFVAIARAGSFRAAAERIHISQPALSHSIQVLEAAVGEALFRRSKQGIQLTRAGEELVRFSERLIVEVEGVEQRLKSPDDELAGVLCVGTFTSLLVYLWPPILKKMVARHPNLQIHLDTIKATDVTSALSSRKFHLIVSSESIRLQEAINIELYRDSYGFFYSKKWFKKRPDWQKIPLIYVPEARDGNGNSLAQILWRCEIEANQTYRVDNFEAVAALTSEGLGVGILPLRVGRMKNSTLVQIRDKSLFGTTIGEHPIYGSLLEADRSDPRLRRLLELLHDDP